MNRITLSILLMLPLAAMAQFTPETRVTNAAGNSYTSLSNANNMVANGDIVHLVYTDERGMEGEVYYQRSMDGGISWQEVVQLTSDDGSFSGYPSIAVWNNEVHVVWTDWRHGNAEIYYRKSSNGGNTWFTDERISIDPADSNFPSVTTSGPVVHVVWRDERFEHSEIYYRRSINSGLSWGVETRLTFDGGNSSNASVSSSGNNVHVVWQEDRDGNKEIYYKRSTDGGLTWDADLRLTNNHFESNFPSSVAIGKTILIVWSDLRDGNAEIYGIRSVDNGETWSEDIRLTNTSRPSLEPKVVMEGAFAFLTWHELHDGFANWEVESRFSTDGGFSWTQRRQLTAKEGFSGNATVCVEGLLVMTAWSDSRHGETEIYARRNPTGNPLQSTHTLDWAYGVGAASTSVATDIVLDPESNIFMVGNFENTVDFDPGMNTLNVQSAGVEDVFISKTSPSGEVFWAKRIGGPETDHATSVVMDLHRNLIIAGSFEGTADFDPGPGVFSMTAGTEADAFLTKLDQNGEFLWAIKIGGNGFNEIRSVKTDVTGNIYVTGRYEETADFDPTAGISNKTSAGAEDIFIARYNTSGQLQWVQSLGGPGSDEGRGLSVTLAGHVWVTGHFSQSVDFNPKPDDATLTAQGLEDIFIATYTGNGDYIRALRIGGNDNDEVNAMSMEPNGNILLTGMFRGIVDFNPSTFSTFLASNGGDDGFALKLSPSGTFIWARNFGGEENDKGQDIKVDKNGSILVVGYFKGDADFFPGTPDSRAHSSGEEDIFLLKLKTDGNFDGVDQISGAGSDVAEAVAPFERTRVYIAGSFTNKMDADPSADVLQLDSKGADDILLASINVCPAVFSSFSTTVCDSLVSPDGEAVWRSTGTYLDTLVSSNGCDSIVTVFLTVIPHDEINVTSTNCDFYTTPSGAHTWTESGDYMESFTNVNGCDSLIFYHLTIHYSSETEDVQSACDQYVDPLGTVYTTSGFYLYTLADIHGCDSLITLELTIHPSSGTVLTETACDSLVTPLEVFTTSGVYTQIYPSSNGCDSTVTINLTIVHSSEGAESVVTCKSYTTADGEETFDETGIYHFVIPNAAGCDSAVTLDLQIIGPDNTITVSEHSLTANQDSAAYQWMDCIANALIPDAVDQTFSPTEDGTYAVIITQNGCVDTSACVEIMLVASTDIYDKAAFRLFPNPTDGDVNIDLGAVRNNVRLEVTDVYGKRLELTSHQSTQWIQHSLQYPQGVYIFHILADGQRKAIQVVKM